MNYNKTLSIIVPCYNAARFLSEFMDCLIKQTFKNWNAYIIDDGSTDESIEIINKYNKIDDRIILVNRKRLPKGSQTCRNIGIEMAKDSKYIIFFDADDIVAPYCLEQRVKFMESNQDLDFAVFPAKMFYNKLFDDFAIFGVKDNESSDISRLLRRQLPYVVWTNIYKYSSIKKYNHYWDENILSLQDTDYNIQAIVKNMKYAYAVNSPIDYFWRGQSGNNISNKIHSNPHIDSHIYLINKICCCNELKSNKLIKNDIKIFILSFIDLFNSNKYFKDKLFTLSYFKNNLLFYVQTKLYCLLNKRGIRFIFPHLYKYRNKTIEKAELFRKENLKHYTEITINALNNQITHLKH